MKRFPTRIIFILLALCICASVANAQTTLVTGTIVDPGAVPYAGAQLKAQLTVPGATVTINNNAQCASAGQGSAPCKIPIQGTAGPVTLDSAGNIPGGGIVMFDNTFVNPGGTQWIFTVSISPGVPLPLGTGPQTFSATITISGASQNIGAALNALAPKLSNTAAATPPGGISGDVQTNNGAGGFAGGTPLTALANGGTTIYAANAPYNLKFDGGVVYDGSISNGSTNLTSATANWTANAKVGQRIWVVEGQGASTGKLALMGTISSITSSTVVVVSQTSLCNTASPCTNLHVGWGTGGQNTNFQSFMSKLASVNTAVQTCGLLPSGTFVWEAQAFLQPTQTRVCLKSTGHSLLIPAPDFAFGTGGQISFANSNTGWGYDYSDIEIDGMGLITGDGRTAVFQGIGAGAEAVFLSEGTFRNINVHDWGDTVANWNCMFLDNYQWDYNIQCANANFSQTQGCGTLNPVHIDGGWFTTTRSGRSMMQAGCDLDSSHVDWGPRGGGANGTQLVDVIGTSNWHSVQDSFAQSSVNYGIGCVNSGASAWIDHATSSMSGQTLPNIKTVPGCNVYVSNSKLTAGTNQYLCDSHSNSGPGTCIDGGGNTFSGSFGDFVSSNSIGGTACVTGNWALTSGWGASAIASVTAGGDSHRCQVVITGAAGAASPVLTWTFPKAYLTGTPQLPGSCQITFNGTLTGESTGAPTATSVAFTFTGTPSAQTYRLDASCGP
jgi:hypothetical protein